MPTVIIIIVLLVLIGLVLAYAATRPDTFEISRSILISAPPQRIFPLIEDLRALNTWNPFVKADPDIKLAYSDPSSGAGASNEFEGNAKVGAGRLMIIDAHAPSSVVLSLVMERPMKAQNRIEFSLQPQGTATNVTWAMSGAQPFMAKVMCLVMNPDKMVGGLFEKGLADLKAMAEA